MDYDQISPSNAGFEISHHQVHTKRDSDNDL